MIVMPRRLSDEIASRVRALIEEQQLEAGMRLPAERQLAALLGVSRNSLREALAMLVNEGALVLKFWFHLSREGQVVRLKKLEKDPRTAWRVTEESWARLKTYGKLQEAAGHVLRMTNTPWAPWIVVEGTDDRYRSLTVGKVVLDALQKRLADTRDQNFPVAPPIAPKIDSLDVLTALDLSLKLDKKEYEAQLAKWQGRLSELVRYPEFRNHSLILAFEGGDAAGVHGGCGVVGGRGGFGYCIHNYG